MAAKQHSENHLRGLSLHSLKENFIHFFHHEKEDGEESSNSSVPSPLSSPTRKEDHHTHRKNSKSEKSNPNLKTASGTALVPKAKRDDIDEESHHHHHHHHKKNEEENHGKKSSSTSNLKSSINPSNEEDSKHPSKKEEKEKEKESSKPNITSTSSSNIKLKDENNNNNNNSNLSVQSINLISKEEEHAGEGEGEDIKSNAQINVVSPHEEQSCSVSPSNGLEAFERVKLIGRGDVGKVYLVRHKLTGKPYAMKVMSKSEMVQRRKIHRALTEREVLISANFPLLVTMHYSFQNDRNLYFVMDYCAGGEFFRALQKQPNHCLPEHVAKFYACEVLMALEYLHLKGIVYRDLKPENILLQESGHIMLTDFNLSKQTSNVTAKVVKGVFDSYDRAKVEIKPQLFATSLVGTEEYLAPELVKGCAHSQSVDWWTFGIFIYEMLYGVTPFKGKNREETFSLIKKSGIKFPKTPEVSSECKNLITKLLNVNPTKRLGSEHGASDIKSHPFFKDVKWALILNEQPPIIPEISNDFDTSNFREITEEMEDCSSVDLRTKLNDPFRELKDVERNNHERNLGRRSNPNLATISHPNIHLNVHNHNNNNSNTNHNNNNNNNNNHSENHKKE